MEQLICNCKLEDGTLDDSKHVSYIDVNGETVLECKTCLRFLKFGANHPQMMKSE